MSESQKGLSSPFNGGKWGGAALHRALLSGCAYLPATPCACYPLLLQEHSTPSIGTRVENFAEVLLLFMEPLI